MRRSLLRLSLLTLLRRSFAIAMVLLLVGNSTALAASITWTFTTPSNYTYTSSLITVTGGNAQLAETASPAWYNSSWHYRRAITLDNSGNDNFITNVQVEVKLTSSNFTFSNANSDGSDIRFTSSDGTTLLNHWIEAYDNASEVAYISVNVPTISADATTTLYLYYGNSGASTTSSWSDTFTVDSTSPTEANIYTASTYDAFPGSVRLANGDILVSFRSGTDHLTDGKIQLARSTDGGSTWSTTTVYDDVSLDDRTELGIQQLADGTVIWPFRKYDGNFLDVYILKSSDNGATWGSPITVTNPFTDFIASYGKLIERPNGDLWLPATGADTGETGRRVVLMESTDDGDTWSLGETIASDGKEYRETSVLQLDTNNYVVALRVDGTPDIYYSASTDGGSTWSSPSLLFDGVSPDLVQLSNGTMLLCVGDRVVTKGIGCHISHDGGARWSNRVMIYTDSGTAGVDLGYPATVELSDGTLLTPYYYDTDGADDTNVVKAEWGEGYVLNNTFEGVEDGNLTGWVLSQGTTTEASTTQKHTGSYSLHINDTDTVTHNRAIQYINGSGRSYGFGVFSFWIYPVTTAIGPGFILNDGTNTTDRRFLLSLRSDQSLKYYNGSTYVDLPTATSLSLNTWSKITLRFDADNDTSEVFVNGVSKGSIGIANSGGDIQYFEITSGSTSGTGDEVYVDDMYTSFFATDQPAASVGSEASFYSSAAPGINPTAANAQTFTSLSAFSASETTNGGDIKYQVSNDSGSTWYWYNSGWTTTSSGYSEANTASDINTNISTLPAGSNSFLFKAYLNSDGTQLVQLSDVTLTYTNDTTAPVLSLVSASATATGATITWTTDEAASSQVDWGTTASYGTTTAETDTSPRVTSHSVTLSGLTSCTTYHYRVKSTDAYSNQATGSDATFTTTGCPVSSSSSDSGGGGSGDSGEDPVTSGDNSITTSQSTSGEGSKPTITLQSGQRTTLTSTPIDADRLQSLRLHVLGKDYYFVDPEGDGTYILPFTITTPGTYAYALTADWGITTRTEYGSFVVQNTSNSFPISQINQLFRSVFGRTPTPEEWDYWRKRREDKPNKASFLGALEYHQQQGTPIGTLPPATGARIELPELNSVFRSVYGRNPTQSEWSYWAQRLIDTYKRLVFVGALQWHLLNGIIH